MLANISSNSNINFEGYKTTFSKKFEKYLKSSSIEQAEKIDLMDTFQKIVERKMNDKHKLGEGRFNNVFRIDDYYVFRHKKTNPKTIKLPEKHIYPKYNNFLDFKAYQGRILASFGEFKIMKNAVGTNKKCTNAGMPYELINEYNNAKNLNSAKAQKVMMEKGSEYFYDTYVPNVTKHVVNKMGKHYNNVYLPNFSRLPQSAYDKVVGDFKKLNTPLNNFLLPEIFDCYNPNNFIQVGKRIKIIDELSDTIRDSDISDVMKVFLRDYNTPQTVKSEKMKREIFNKCMIACAKNDFTHGTIKLEKTLEFVGIKKSIVDFTQDIKTISELPKNKRIQKLEEYLKEI